MFYHNSVVICEIHIFLELDIMEYRLVKWFWHQFFGKLWVEYNFLTLIILKYFFLELTIKNTDWIRDAFFHAFWNVGKTISLYCDIHSRFASSHLIIFITFPIIKLTHLKFLLTCFLQSITFSLPNKQLQTRKSTLE